MRAGVRLRVALVGAGYFARYHAEAWASIDDVELVAIFDPDPGRAEALALGVLGHVSGVTFDNAEAMFDQAAPDLIDIASPPASHLFWVERAVERGLPAICQKPLASTWEEARIVAAMAEAAGCLLVVHENFRFQPWYREARRLLEAGLLGEPANVTFCLRPGDGGGQDAYLARQPYFRQMERFLIRETGIHFIDTFRYLMGEITDVSARLRRVNPAIEGEDAGLILFDFVSGATGLFDGNRALPPHPAVDPRLTMGEMLLEGSDAALRLDGDGRLFLRQCGREDEHRYDWHNRGFAGNCVEALQRHVVDHLLHGAGLENSAADYLRNLIVEEAIYQSSDELRPIVISDAAKGGP